MLQLRSDPPERPCETVPPGTAKMHAVLLDDGHQEAAVNARQFAPSATPHARCRVRAWRRHCLDITET